MNNKIRVLSLFSGCGGMDLGMEGGFFVHEKSVIANRQTPLPHNKKLWLNTTGFETVFACDIKPSAKTAWETWFERGDTFTQTSIVDLVTQHKAGLYNFSKDIDIVTGGFPCQDFSLSGKRQGFKSTKSHNNKQINTEASIESRGMLYYWMREVINITKPKIFIAENVKGLVSLGDVKNIIVNDFKSAGGGYFIVEPKILQAADYGVPQSRERVIFIGIRQDLLTPNLKHDIEQGNYQIYPQTTHNKSNYVSVKDVLGDLQEPEYSLDISQKSYSKAKWYGKHCQGQTEVDWNGISPTIRSEHHGNIEFRRLSQEHGGKINHEYDKPERRLTVRECARIQTFPDEFIFVSDKISASQAYKLIGNAVPPLLAWRLAIKIKELLSKLNAHN